MSGTKREEFDRIMEEGKKFFHDEADKHKRLHRRFNFSILILAAATTVTASLALVVSEHMRISLNIAVVVFTAISSLLNAIEARRKFGELWQNERIGEYALKDIERAVRYYSSDGGSVDLDAYFEEMQTILKTSRQKWLKYVQPAEHTKPHAVDDAANEHP